METTQQLQLGTRMNYPVFRTKSIIILITSLLLLYIFINNRSLIRRAAVISDNVIFRSFKSLQVPSTRISNNHLLGNCSIEVFGGFDGVEQAFISGTLFRDIAETCSCYTHYRRLETFVSDRLEAKVSTSHPSGSIGRVVWCVRSCPQDIMNWCMNERHRDYCQKHVVLVDLSDEYFQQPVYHYPYFAAVYRNYLRNGIVTHISYLTQHLRKVPRTKDTLRMHRILNWSLAIDIMKDEWKAAGLDVDNVSNKPTADIAVQLNNRITTRLSLNNEGIVYHTWPDLDAKIRNHVRKNVSVFWFPLGYTNIYLADAVQSSAAPLSKRQKLWSWSGSLKLNERPDMIKAFQGKDKLTEYIKQQGLLAVTGGFAEGVQFMDYTSQLLDSQFVPLPCGTSPEQFRSYEASNAGAILIVNEQWLKIHESMNLAPLAYLNILGYDPVTISSFSYLPQKLLELSRLPPELLDEWQLIMLSRHRIVMRTMTKHIASVLCAANTPNGYVFKDEQELL